MVEKTCRGTFASQQLNVLETTTLLDVLHWRATHQTHQRIYTFLHNGEKEDGTLTFGELDQKARSIGTHLQKITHPGDRAVLLYPAGLDFITAFLGCLYAGVLAVPAYPPRNERHLPRIEAILEDSGAQVVLVAEQFEGRVQTWLTKQKDNKKRVLLNTTSVTEVVDDGHGFQASPDTLAFLQYTSGSTASPKGVMVSHGNLIHNLRMIQKACGYTAESAFVSWLPVYHDMGLIGNILQPLFLGSECVLMSPAAVLQRPLRWLEAMSHYQARTSGAPNFAFDLCVKNTTPAQRRTLDLSCLDVLYNGSEPIRAETIARFSEAFATSGFRAEAFYPCYGLAETTLMVTGSDPTALPVVCGFDQHALEKGEVVEMDVNQKGAHPLVGCGRTVLEGQIEIVDPKTGLCCSEGEIGEVWVAGPHVAQGYWQNEKATKETFGGHLSDTGEGPFLRTGDLGFVAQNELFIVGRIKDLIIIRGRNHYPQDIEETVTQCHPALRPAGGAAFALTEGDGVGIVQEVERLFLKNLPIDDVVDAICKAVSEHHGVSVARILLIKPGYLPKTSSGKVQRQACRVLTEGKYVVGTWHAEDHKNQVKAPIDEVKKAPAKRDDLLALVQDQIHQMLGKNDRSVLDEDVALDQLGLDSLKVFDLIARLEKERGIVVSVEMLTESLSLGQLVDLLTEGAQHTGSKASQNGYHHVGDPTVSVSQIKEMLLKIPQINCLVTGQSGRQLQIDGNQVIDFASCNYLGFDHHEEIKNAIPPMIDAWGVHPSWTRAVASPEPYVELERKLADLVGAPDTVIFPSVAMLNSGVLPVLAGPNGVILTDHDLHTTVQEACELAAARGATWLPFKHNDLEDLERQLQKYQHASNIIIAVDGVYSMTAEYVSLPDFCVLAKKYNALVYVDDAHGFGIIGASPSADRPYGLGGSGIVQYHGMDYETDRIIYVAGLSKAYSSYAAFVTCFDSEMKQRFQMSTPYIFSGPIPTASIASGLAGLDVNAREGDAIREKLYGLTSRLVDGARALGFEVDNHEGFPIVFVVTGGVDATIRACEIAWEHGILITPGVFPAVSLHRGGLRFSMTASNTEDEIETTLKALQEIKRECTQNDL